MIQGKILSYGDDLKEIYEIRTKVFIEELGISRDIEFDIHDPDAIHVLVYEEQNSKQEDYLIPVATGRITYDGDVCEIGHIAVLENYRNKDYGDFAVRMLINRALLSGLSTITILSPKKVIGFFEKVGFVIDNDQNSDVDVLRMILNLNDIETMCKCKHS